MKKKTIKAWGVMTRSNARLKWRWAWLYGAVTSGTHHCPVEQYPAVPVVKKETKP